MLKSHKYWLGLFWLVAIFVLPLPLVMTLAQGLDGTINQFALFGSQIGIIAYVWMLFAIVVAEKPKWLDRLIGLPEMYFAHGILGLGAILLAIWHKILLQAVGLVKITGLLSVVIFIAVACYSIFFMSAWLTGRSLILRRFKARLEKIFRYETSLWIHRLNVVATLLVFAHVVLIDFIRAIGPFMFWFYLYSAFTAITYLYMHGLKPHFSKKGMLISRQKLADGVTELTVKMKRRWRFRPGDYVFMAFPDIKGMDDMHPFSILHYDRRAHLLTFAIRNWGDFTAKIDAVPIKSRIKIDGSYGRLFEAVNEKKAKDLIFIGSGVGSVPLISLTTALLNKRKITFIRIASQRQDLIYEDFLQQLAVDYPNFTYRSQIGRLSQEQVEHLAKTDAFYLVGGSSQMMKGTMGMLLKVGIKRQQMYGEKFSF